MEREGGRAKADTIEPFLLSGWRKITQHKTGASAAGSSGKRFVDRDSVRETTETRENKIAHKEFLRITKLLARIEKHDDLYGAMINRYCILYAENKEFEQKRERFYQQLCEFQERRRS